MNNPLISVPIPAYKTGPYIDACIKSVADQTYRNLDIAVLVQPSEDDTAKIAEAWAKKDIRVRVIYLPFADVSNARNECIKNVYGELVCFVDSDDMIHREHIQRMYRVMEETGADIVQVKDYPFHNEAELPEEIPGTGELLTVNGREFELSHQIGEYGHWASVIQTKLYKKEMFEGVTFPVGRICEDVATLFRIYTKAEKIVIMDSQSYFYRSGRTDSITHFEGNRIRLIAEGYLGRRDMWEFFRDYDPEIASFCAYYICNDIARARGMIERREFKSDETLAEMKKRRSEFLRACDGRYVGRQRKALATLGRYFPRLWYRLNNARTQRARRIEWAAREES